MTGVRFPGSISAIRSCLHAGVTLGAMCAASLWAQNPQVDVLRRDGLRASGVLTEDPTRGFHVLAATGETISCDQIQSVELVTKPRLLPDRRWQRLVLSNGDILHAQLLSSALGEGQVEPNIMRWDAGFESSLKLPLAALSQITPPIATQTVVLQDFEHDAAGWLSAAGTPLPTSREHARSGKYSLACSASHPVLRYPIDHPVEHGWLEFHFFIDGEGQDQGRVVATILLSDSRNLAIHVDLTGPTKQYATACPGEGTWQRQNVARQPGWHTLRVASRAGRIRVLLDDFLLADGTMPAASNPKLSGVTLTATQPPSSVWIDDFAVTRATDATETDTAQIEILDRHLDQINLTNGDQLFGRLDPLTSQSVVLQSSIGKTEINWIDTTGLHFGARRFVARGVTGQIVTLDLQPWAQPLGEPHADVLTGALISINESSFALDHALCGKLIIPRGLIQRIWPQFYGQSWTLEGQLYHLGDEVKASFQQPLPDGTKLTRTFEVTADTSQTAAVVLTTIDVEPAGPGTLDHPWLKRLQGGELTSELWLNDGKIAVLNQAITGRGTTAAPQRMRFPVTLQAGKNKIEIRLNSSLQQPLEYDDWELMNWRVELPSSPK